MNVKDDNTIRDSRAPARDTLCIYNTACNALITDAPLMLLTPPLQLVASLRSVSWLVSLAR